jgi:two-component system, chemotaxis family, chemotaxis protein CheY
MGLQVLIVDDSASMRAIVRRAVSLTGYDVSGYLEAGNGQEALEVLDSHWVDVVLLDVHMPVMDGLTMVRRMREQEVLRRIPVVLVSTEARQSTIDEAFQLGVRGHVRKPFQPESFRKTFDEVLGNEYVRKSQTEPEGSDF